jgi:hypothetical protein
MEGIYRRALRCRCGRRFVHQAIPHGLSLGVELQVAFDLLVALPEKPLLQFRLSLNRE